VDEAHLGGKSVEIAKLSGQIQGHSRRTQKSIGSARAGQLTGPSKAGYPEHGKRIA
jgi:hypothetical protein